MTRYLLLAAALITLSGCRLFNCNKSSCQGPSSMTPGAALPVSYGTPAPNYPASYSTPLHSPVIGVPTSYPTIPAPSNTIELPYPEAAAPTPPNATRSVGLPK